MKSLEHRQIISRAACILGTVLGLSLSSTWAADPALTPNVGANPLGYVMGTGTRGWEFTLSQSLYVTDLGVFDAGQDGLSESHQIGIWNLSGNLIIDATIQPGTGAPLVGLFRYVDVPDTLLVPGSYAIGALYNDHGPDVFPQNSDSITTFPGISYVQPRYADTLARDFAFPNVGQGIGNGFNHFGPNLMVIVPEPSSFALLVFASLAIAVKKMRR